MYEITCPHCQKESTYMETEGHFGSYIPYNCDHCDKKFYILHRSWFDPTYDNHNVDVKTQEELEKMVQAGSLKHGV